VTRGWRPLVLTAFALCLTLLATDAVAREASPDPYGEGGGPRALQLGTVYEPEPGNLPDGITCTLQHGELIPANRKIAPSDDRPRAPFSWQVTISDDWVTVARSNGMTPNGFHVSPSGFASQPGVTQTGTLTVPATFPLDVAGSPHTSEVSFHALDELTHTAHLPLAAKHYQAPVSPRVPNDAHVNQWALATVMAPLAWAYSTGEGTVIAVIDSGIDTDHPDLASKLWVNGGEILANDTDDDGNGYVDDAHGWRFDKVVGHGPDVEDDNGHGTHVAGIAAAATDNGQGIAGLGWDAQIQVIKALNSAGDGWLTDIVDALFYAADNGANVINLSLGLAEASACPPSLQAAVDYARASGAVVVAASGNTALPSPETYPANCDGVLGVAATDRYDLVTPYSNSGHHVSVSAPGGALGCPTCQIYSTAWPGDPHWRCSGRQYCYKQGTSMATPHVAGLAALLVARYPAYTPDQVASAILDNAVDLGTAGWDEKFGCGRIDAAAALANGAAGPEPLCLQGLVGSSPAALAEDRPPTALPEPAFAPGEIIVALQPGVSASGALARHGTLLERLPRLDAWRLQVPAGREEAVLIRLRAEPAVLYAHLNHLVFAQ